MYFLCNFFSNPSKVQEFWNIKIFQTTLKLSNKKINGFDCNWMNWIPLSICTDAKYQNMQTLSVKFELWQPWPAFKVGRWRYQEIIALSENMTLFQLPCFTECLIRKFGRWLFHFEKLGSQPSNLRIYSSIILSWFHRLLNEMEL